MSNLNIAIILIILVVVILLLIVVITLLNKKQPSNTVTQKREVNRYVPLPSSIGLFLPPAIEKIGRRQLQDIVRKVFDSYKCFDYQKMSVDELDKKEWHTWQVSLALMLFKYEEEFFIPNQEKLFHSFLINSTQDDIKSLMNSILKKYKNYVDLNFTKDALSKEYIWTNRDISIIFYFLANYKNYKK